MKEKHLTNFFASEFRVNYNYNFFIVKKNFGTYQSSVCRKLAVKA